jgi:hypothetical protein
MKKVLFALAFVAFGTVAAQAQAPQQKTAKVDNKAPRFQFIGGETHDFGTLKEGPSATYVFQFKNVGKEPLIITNASASCGCTVPEFPKEPILPGKKGQLKVTYNTAGKSGPFDKTVFIQSNAPSNVAGDRYELHVKGNVVPGNQTSATTPAKS